MTWFAQLVLIATSVCPVAIVFGAVQAERGQDAIALACGVLSGSLLLLCYALLRGVVHRIAAAPHVIKDPAAKEAEQLGFLVAYALPVVTFDSSKGSTWGLVAFTVLMGLVLWQRQVFHVNPLLALIGYQCFSAKDDSGTPILALTRNKVLSPGVNNVVKISEYLWLVAKV